MEQAQCERSHGRLEFSVQATPAETSAAIYGAFNLGAGAKLRKAISGIRVEGSGHSYRFESRIGDIGRIQLASTGTGTKVSAFTDELYVGSHPMSHWRSGGYWGWVAAMGHRINKLLGITPGAARMKRFQRGLEGKIAKQLREAAV
ncbi:MAG: hypothetical protein ACT4OM_11555 [Actinomycetota bacterium]